MRKTVFALMLLVMCCCCSAFGAETVGNDYIMCPGDQLQVVVYGHDDLSSTPNAPYVVRPDGELSFPLIGDVTAAGKTVESFAEELRVKFAEYLVEPQVTINVLKLGTTRIYVLGEVKRPGMYELEKSHRVVDALSMAEGFTERSSKKKIYLIRKNATEPILVNIEAFLKKADQSQNYVLNEGDCLYLTRSFKVNFSRDILPLINGVYMIHEINEDN